MADTRIFSERYIKIEDHLAALKRADEVAHGQFAAALLKAREEQMSAIVYGIAIGIVAVAISFTIIFLAAL